MRQNRVTMLRNPPLVESGIAATLAETEFELVSVAKADLAHWIEDGGMAIVGVRQEEDLGFVVDLRAASPDGVVITLVAGGASELVRGSLRAGASSSIPLDSDLRSLVLVLRASQSRLAVMPEAVSRSLDQPATAAPPPGISEAEIDWLAALANGATVGDIADQAGYSERAMFRLLSSLYRSLGAESRVGALIAAAKLGLI